MLKFILVLIIPLYIGIYTILFGRWMQRKRNRTGAFSAYALALLSVSACTYMLWKMFT